MAQPTQNANALTFAQNIINFNSQLKYLLGLAEDIQESQANHNYAANLQAMPTYALNADGSQGATDGSPQQGNPIVGLNVSFYNLDQSRINLANDLVTLLTGSGAVSTLDRRPKIDALLT
jgi:hypothetical protein